MPPSRGTNSIYESLNSSGRQCRGVMAARSERVHCEEIRNYSLSNKQQQEFSDVGASYICNSNSHYKPRPVFQYTSGIRIDATTPSSDGRARLIIHQSDPDSAAPSHRRAVEHFRHRNQKRIIPAGLFQQAPVAYVQFDRSSFPTWLERLRGPGEGLTPAQFLDSLMVSLLIILNARDSSSRSMTCVTSLTAVLFGGTPTQTIINLSP
ncbi:hypothetical protein CERZMDRAFT_80832 [Cercospora zeae-maydis SCOH1-5]|uniref:Uncharacterized protein n=1 Tax=Cercospora zeae-maydis SCOH1-5 TaxID=717836 RepID=A0A6A6FUB1_9PEZI|nr:hypothetical protein CERZMDRAFT_80832 [Cercospora zeae-maydis SCOH1-5]